jgi:predicted 2-oxoglutarate/Fe(II)-dependent dioxygenase YbiX
MSPLLLPAFLDPATCRRIRAAMDRGERDAAEIAGDEIAEQATVRRAFTIEIEPALLAEVEGRIEDARVPIERWCGDRLGGREGTGLLRYEAGGFYLPHRDRGNVSGWPGAASRAVAVVVFLNAGFEGGALTLHPERDAPIRIEPAEGLLVAFPADMLHEVWPVAHGVRDAAVDWFYDLAEGEGTHREPNRI